MPTLNWSGRDEAIKVANKVPFRLLEADDALSYGESSDNMIIQGDNLEALKALLPYYKGQVKCIYIDPPFNTKQAFDEYDDNMENSIWLSMMYPRLELLHQFLTDDGSMFIHIDDNQISYVMVILDEIFGRKNRSAIITFKQGAPTGHKAINPGVVTTTNYILIYARNKNVWKPNRLFTARNRDKRYAQIITNPESPYEEWQMITLSKAFSEYHGKKISELKKELGDDYEKYLDEFVLNNAARVIRSARPDYKSVGADVKCAIDESKQKSNKIILHKRNGYPDMYFKNGERIIFYKDKLKQINGKFVAGEPLTNLWEDLLSNNLHNEGEVIFPKGKKPEALIKRVFEMSTNQGDLVIDAFLGSGTTTAVAHKLKRSYIGIEMGTQAITHVIPRMKKVVDGEQGGISKDVTWHGGGGFRFYKLGEAIFDEYGGLNPAVKFPTLAAHIWFTETRIPYMGKADSPLLGIHDGVAYYLLYNGILGDKRPDSGNVLTTKIINIIPPYDGPKVIYGEASRFGDARLSQLDITFKQTPYDIKIH